MPVRLSNIRSKIFGQVESSHRSDVWKALKRNDGIRNDAFFHGRKPYRRNALSDLRDSSEFSIVLESGARGANWS
jgi:hypothetical protein